MANLQTTTFNATDRVTLPAGTNADRPAPVTGMMRYNNTSGTALLEFYDGVNWRPITGYSQGTIGTGGNEITYTNAGIIHVFTSGGTFTPAFSGAVQVLVVGGAGYIGSHMVKRLGQLCCQVGNRPLEPRALEVEFFPMEEVLHEKVKIH